MIKGIGFFIFVWMLVYFGIQAVRSMKAQERWSAVKSLTYSACTAIIAVVAVVVIVVIF